MEGGDGGGGGAEGVLTGAGRTKKQQASTNAYQARMALRWSTVVEARVLRKRGRFHFALISSS